MIPIAVQILIVTKTRKITKLAQPKYQNLTARSPTKSKAKSTVKLIKRNQSIIISTTTTKEIVYLSKRVKINHLPKSKNINTRRLRQLSKIRNRRRKLKLKTKKCLRKRN